MHGLKGYKYSMKHSIHALIYSMRAIDADTRSPNVTTYLSTLNFDIIVPESCTGCINHLRLLCNTEVTVSSQSSFCHSALKQRVCIYRYQDINE